MICKCNDNAFSLAAFPQNWVLVIYQSKCTKCNRYSYRVESDNQNTLPQQLKNLTLNIFNICFTSKHNYRHLWSIWSVFLLCLWIITFLYNWVTKDLEWRYGLDSPTSVKFLPSYKLRCCVDHLLNKLWTLFNYIQFICKNNKNTKLDLCTCTIIIHLFKIHILVQ